MNLELFIAKRLLGSNKKTSISVPIINIAVIGIALGIFVMLLSIFIVTGFKQEITTKLSGFTSHINITSYDDNYNTTSKGIELNNELLTELNATKEIKQAYSYITKPTILKSQDNIHGVILKGVDSTYNANFYKNYLVAGTIPSYTNATLSNNILISSSIAKLLNVKQGDKIQAHFVQNPPRARVFTIQGIYDTGFKEYDELTVICDISHLQTLNSWDKNRVSGIAIELQNIQDINKQELSLYETLAKYNELNYIKIETLHDSAPDIFDWLELLNINIKLIITLIIIVAGFNMVSGLLILILDKTRMIGLLKTLGYKNISLKKLFLYIALGLMTRGIVLGNIFAFIIAGIQYLFNPIKLDASTYYMSYVPINFNILHIIGLNLGIILISTIILLAPTILISKIQPIKAIRFD